MPSLFTPRLINGPFDDPGLFIPFCYERRALAFDLGNLGSLSSRDILKISHAFITHTHMDHFIGFDALFRLVLGREKTLDIYGPENFLGNLEGKLASYSWDLVENFDKTLLLRGWEVGPDHILKQEYRSGDKFIPLTPPEQHPFSGLLVDEPSFRVSAAVLEHSIPCLGFSIDEKFRVNIKKNALLSMGLDTGPWLKDFKDALYEKQPEKTIFKISCKRSGAEKSFKLGELKERIVKITPGRKFAYVTDVGWSPGNLEKIINLVRGSHHLFIESAFLHKDKDIALRKHHLTARWAGEIAARAQVSNLTVFHFSPRYDSLGPLLEEEAAMAHASGITKEFS